MATDDQVSAETIRAYKRELLDHLFGVTARGYQSEEDQLRRIPEDSNIVGIGFGAKISDNKTEEDAPALRVYVREKMPFADVSPSERVPDSVEGIPTDVIEVGPIDALVSCGVSIGHYLITAGTLGCLVQKSGESDEYILSNNHVLSDSLAGSIGDNILQPGKADGGVNPKNAIATLSQWGTIDFTGKVNYIDAAIAKVKTSNGTSPVTPDISTIGRLPAPTSAMTPVLYQSVRKHGRTTGHTVGVVVDVNAPFLMTRSVFRARAARSVNRVTPVPLS
jgi:hypothetical protein